MTFRRLCGHGKRGKLPPQSINKSATHQTPQVKAKRRQYEEQFKHEAVALLLQGCSATQLARELRVSQWNLREWKEIYGAGCAVVSPQARSAAGTNAGAASTVELAVQLADMRRERHGLFDNALTNRRVPHVPSPP